MFQKIIDGYKNLKDQNQKKKAEKARQAAHTATTAKELSEILNKTYSPNALAYVEAQYPVELMKMEKNRAGHLVTSLWDSVPEKIVLNSDYTNIYVLGVTLEHESIHWKQCLRPFMQSYKPWNFVKPQQAYKISVMMEMEARFGELYKFAKDYKDGAISDEQVPIIYEDSCGMMIDFVEAYKGKSIVPTQVAVYEELNKIRKSANIRRPEEIMAEFFYNVSRSSDYIDLFVDQYIITQDQTFEMFKNNPKRATEYLKIMKQKGENLGSSFTLKDASNFLSDTGLSPLNKLSYKKQEEFIRNISYLHKDKRQQVEGYKQQVAAYLGK